MNLLFHNGTKVLTIGVPKDAYDITLIEMPISANYWKPFAEHPTWKLWYSMDSVSFRQGQYLPQEIKNGEILGTFTPPSELTMEVKEEWVSKQLSFGKFKDYEIEGTSIAKYGSHVLYTARESFISYLLSEIQKADCKEEKFVIIEIK